MSQSPTRPVDFESLGLAPAQLALRQVADLIVSQTKHKVELDLGAGSFFIAASAGDASGGPRLYRAQTCDDAIVLQVQLAWAGPQVRAPAAALFRCLGQLGERCRLIPPVDGSPGLWAELRVQAVPLSPIREASLVRQLGNLTEIARTLSAELPEVRRYADLDKLYEKAAEVLRPVYPLDDELEGPSGLAEWAAHTLDFAAAGASIALCAASPLLVELALAALAREARKGSLGRLLVPSITTRAVVDLARQAPGTVVIPASRLGSGAGPYDLAIEVAGMLSTLGSLHRPAIFTGSFAELQAVFHGGQGGDSDPMRPVLRRVPAVPLEVMARFELRLAARETGGLTPSAESELTEAVVALVVTLPAAEQLRLLPLAARRAVTDGAQAASALVARARGLDETLAGLSPRPRASRPPAVQERFAQTLTDPSLLPSLQHELLGQDHALEALVFRLRTEVLTRPLHQPLRYCAQGTPGTGKSESAALLARRLGVPHVNVDAASLSDYHTASSQLLGSGRGIVGSFQSGRLEQVAKHHAGAVLEVSDLDHATPQVRSFLADLFLQVLETGEAQSATGAMFSCASIIFAFTMNLPDGRDEAVRKGIGFGGRPSEGEVSARVSDEIRLMLSGAFLSRVGTPILFGPLPTSALVVVVERAVFAALEAACTRLGIRPAEIALEPGLGVRILRGLGRKTGALGARAALEHARAAAADALLHSPDLATASGRSLLASSDEDGRIHLLAH